MHEYRISNKEHLRGIIKQWKIDNRIHLNELERIRHRKLRPTYKCQLCGRGINSRYKFHTECVVNQVLELIKNGESVNKTIRCRLECKGYTVGYLREMLKEEANAED